MDPRFKLTADGTVHIDDGTLSYTDTLENALADIAAAELTVVEPDLEAASGAVAVAGFEVSALKREFILENGWHYPMNAAQAAAHQQYADCIGALADILAAKDARLSAE